MEISIAEYVVYAILAYSGMMILIVSTLKEPPMTRVLAIARAIYLIPSAICAGILASVAINIDITTTTTNNLIKSINTTQTWTEATTQTTAIVLQNPVWSMVHWLIMVVLIFYIIQQILFLFTKSPRQGPQNDNEQD